MSIPDYNLEQINNTTVSTGSGAVDAGTQRMILATDQPSVAVSDIVDTAGSYGAISVTNSATLMTANGSSALANRKVLTIVNNSGTQATLYWGYSNSVTTSTGTPLLYGQMLSLSIGPSLTVYMIAASSSHDTRVTEAS